MVQGHTIPLGDFDVEEDAARVDEPPQRSGALSNEQNSVQLPGDAPPSRRWPAPPPPPRRRRGAGAAAAAPPIHAAASRPSLAVSSSPGARGAAARAGAGRGAPCRYGRRGTRAWVPYAEKVGSAKRYRGTVKARDSGERLPAGCLHRLSDRACLARELRGRWEGLGDARALPPHRRARRRPARGAGADEAAVSVRLR